MPLNLEQKKAVVAELAREVQQAQAGVVADYRGLSVADMNKLRALAREANVYTRVIKNTLAKRAMQGTDFECLEHVLEGPAVVLLSRDEPNAAARIVRHFLKDNETLKVKALALNGTLYQAEELEKIAELPSKDEAVAQLLGLLKAPIRQFVRTLAEPQASLARTIAAVRDQKQAA